MHVVMSFMRNSGDPIGCSNSNFVCYSLTGSQNDVAVKYNWLEVGQTHSSEEAPEQNQTKFGGGGRGAKGFDREKVIQQK